ncbi:helix-turn-helix domain-containing protein [Pseudomonas sp. NY15354]|uniref:helix-turn-helix domain-containing protein n=1 Tax=Pseudomonas sp. NY15354 TaxID=3400351 RepID=UPI003A88E9F7
MSSNTLRLNESPALIESWSTNTGETRHSETNTPIRNVHTGVFSVRASDLASAHTDFDALLTELESNPENSEDLARAGSWVADVLLPEGETLRSARRRKGFSQKRLAEIIGSTQPHLSNIESGKGDLMFETVVRLCKALDISLADFQQMKSNQIATKETD